MVRTAMQTVHESNSRRAPRQQRHSSSSLSSSKKATFRLSWITYTSPLPILLLLPYVLIMSSASLSTNSPCMSICSVPVAFFTTEAPHANFLPKSFAASESFTLKPSRPVTVVTHFFLLRVWLSSTTCG
eukprot:GHRQ01021264.1.p2 GENE.GHRQ01021264.1~~GHRQ01021264.1.p2  ORF type:complete len:129 (-),score=1.47 GHRQ01021264.1:539-925(-)